MSSRRRGRLGRGDPRARSAAAAAYVGGDSHRSRVPHAASRPHARRAPLRPRSLSSPHRAATADLVGPDAEDPRKGAERALKRAFGAYPTGVTVVTTFEGGAPRGFTANSFTSVSIDPPLLLVCHSNRAGSAPAFRSAKGFAVNVLAADQEDVAMRFARPGDDKFAGLDWRAGEGGPILPGVAAWLDCAHEATHPGGDHAILVGRVLAHDDAGTDPLAYWRGRFYPGFPPS